MANVMGFLREHNTKKTVEQASLIVPNNFTHSYAVGKTGSGKTSSYIYPNLKNRVKNGNGILLFDYKGKEHRSVKLFASNHNRLKDVIEIGVPWGKSCNLIKNFNEKELRNLVVSIMNMSNENDYWSTASANLSVAIAKTIKAYLDVVDSAENLNIKKTYENLLLRFRLPLSLTFSNIADITKSIQSISIFLTKAQKLVERFDSTTKKKIEDWSEKYDTDDVKKKYLELMTKVLFYKNLVNTELTSLEVFKDAAESSDTRSTSLQTLLVAISTTFSSISDNKFFNDNDGIDLAEALNDGKIIIINAQEISDVILSSLTGSILQELSKRVRLTKIHPVSIFIDESQRVLSKEVDLHTDILREAKVELFLAFQNYSLMNNALGKSKFTALIQNLVTSFNFSNSIDYGDLETSKLNTFSYYKNGEDTIYIAKPMFLDAEEIFEVELEYFKINDVYEQLNIDEKDRDKVIQFNPYLFQHGKIDLKSRDDSLTTIKLRDKKSETVALSSINEFIVNHQASLRHKINQGTSDTALSDLFTQKMNEINLAKEH